MVDGDGCRDRDRDEGIPPRGRVGVIIHLMSELKPRNLCDGDGLVQS